MGTHPQDLYADTLAKALAGAGYEVVSVCVTNPKEALFSFTVHVHVAVGYCRYETKMNLSTRHDHHDAAKIVVARMKKALPPTRETT